MINIACITGCRVGRVKVIFRLPPTINRGFGHIASPSIWPKQPLAYIELYSSLKSKSGAEDSHGMYAVKKIEQMEITSSGPKGIVIPLSQIRQSCMLFPSFHATVDRSWTSENVLDKCSSFFVSNWSSIHAYQSIY